MRRLAPAFASLSLLLLPLALGGGGGCVLPIPRPETRVASSRRAPQSEKILAVGVPREQVLLALGEPDHDWDHDRVLIYGWTTTKLTCLWAAAYGYEGSGGVVDFPINYLLLIEFDPAGRVKRWETRKAAWRQSGDELLAQLETQW